MSPRRAAVLLAAVVAAGCGGAAVTDRPDPQPTTRLEDVDIGGRSLHLECRGTPVAGRPTVMFEAGLGGAGLAQWRSVVDGIDDALLACAYDRAGLRLSDPPPTTPRTTAQLAADLVALLDAAGIEPPYLFVSHSLGPWVTTPFAVAHRDDVVGLVFVDPRGPDVTERWIAGLGAPVEGEPRSVTDFRDWVTTFADPSANAEVLDVSASEAELRAALAASPAFGDTPLVVLSAAGTPDEWPALPPDARAVLETAWFDGHRALAAASSAGRVVGVPASGHSVQLDAPGVVVDAILAIVEGR